MWGGARKEEVVHPATVTEAAPVLFPVPLTKAPSDSVLLPVPTHANVQSRGVSARERPTRVLPQGVMLWSALREVSVPGAPRVEVLSNIR